MEKGAIFFLVIVGAVVAWMPSGPEGVSHSSPAPGTFAMNSPDSNRPAAGISGQSTRTSRDQAWSSGATVLDRQPDGHFYAEATVDAASYRFLVDTGASVVALTAQDANGMGLQWNDSDLTMIGRGASGPVYGVPITLDRMELGGFEAHNVRAAIIPEGLDVSLLGQSFLSQLGSVQIDGDRMTLGSSS